MKNFIYIYISLSGIIYSCGDSINKTENLTDVLTQDTLKSNAVNNPDTIQYLDTNESSIDDTSIFAYIENQGNYTDLNDNNKISGQIKPYHTLIVDYLNENVNGSEGYYIGEDYIDEDSLFLDVPISHIDGFYFERRELRKGQYWLGNMSGKDGTIKIDKENMEVISFLRWQ